MNSMKKHIGVLTTLVSVAAIVLMYYASIGMHRRLYGDASAAPLRMYAQGPSTALAPVGGVISTNVVMTLTADGPFLWVMCGNDSGYKALAKLNGTVGLLAKDFIIYGSRTAFPTCGGDNAIEVDYVTILVYSDVVTPTEVTTDVWCVAW